MTQAGHDSEPPGETGWHADDARDRYRYWDGERFVFTASAADLHRYRELDQALPGLDVHAPVHGELASEAQARAAAARRRTLTTGAVVALVVVVAVVVALVVL